MTASTIITGILGSVPLSVKAADHEARIGDVYYEDIESAFQNVQAGETITVLKDCSVSETLRVISDDITIKSEDGDVPVTVSRDENFTGKTYGVSGAVYSSAPLTITNSLIKDNESVYDGGGIATATGHTAHITGCTFTGNTAPSGSAIQTMKCEGTLPLVIRDCTFTGNPSAGRQSITL